MPNTPGTGVRIDPELVDAVRKQLDASDVSLSVLARAALILVAHPDVSRAEALARAKTRPGPKPRAGAGA